jgi:uncharacterized protein YjbJ (UPF0337 family)
MNWDQLQGKWKQMKGAIRQKWGRLTDDDLEIIAGHRDTFIGTVQERYGIAREEARNRVEEWLRALAETDSAREDSAREAALPKAFSGKP